MTTLPVANDIHPAGTWTGTVARCELSYEDRFFRRRKLSTIDGRDFIADFPKVTSLNDGDALALPDGQLIEIVAAPERLLCVTGANLSRLAWHIGNRHTPCQIEPDRLLVRDDPVIRNMLDHLGATIVTISEPFTPEGGAYGHGRTHSHEHGHSTHVP